MLLLARADFLLEFASIDFRRNWVYRLSVDFSGVLSVLVDIVVYGQTQGWNVLH